MSDPLGRILVFGATGRQGGAVARHLLKGGWPVRAVTRNPDKPTAQALAELGAELVAADLNDPASLPAALEGCYGVFSVQNYWEKGIGFEGEIRQGKALADAAKAAGITHVVHASISKGPAADADGPEHFRCKWLVEDHLSSIEQPFTALRTVFFHDNFADPKVGGMLWPVLTGGLDADVGFHGVVVDDIGAMAQVLFSDPERYIGQHVDLASDVLTVAEMKRAYTAATGKKTARWYFPRWLLRLMSGEMHSQMTWNNNVKWTFTMDEVREHLPEPTGFEQYCRDHLS